MAKVRVDPTAREDIAIVLRYVEVNAGALGKLSLSAASALSEKFGPWTMILNSQSMAGLITWAIYLRDKLADYDYDCDAHRIMSDMVVALEFLKLEMNNVKNCLPSFDILNRMG